MISKAHLFSLFFFTSTVFSLSCYTGGRMTFHEQVEEQPLKSEDCLGQANFCIKMNIDGWRMENGVRQRAFGTSHGCGVLFCQRNGCYDRKISPKDFPGQADMMDDGEMQANICCCTGDLCNGENYRQSSRRLLL